MSNPMLRAGKWIPVLILCLLYIPGFSQLQFAGTNLTSAFAVNTNGHSGSVTEFNPEENLYNLNPVQGPDSRIYYVYNGFYIEAIAPDGSGRTTLATLPSDIRSKLVFGPDNRLYCICSNNNLYALNMDGSGLTTVATVLSSYALSADADGWLYGLSQTTPNVLFRVKTDGSGYAVLHSFDQTTEGSTSNNHVSLCITPNGRLFGVMSSGGPVFNGTVYSMKTDGSDFSIHHDFTNTANGNTVVAEICYQHGYVFWLTGYGATYGGGAVNRMDTTGNNLTILLEFNPGTSAIGYNPASGLVPGNNGKLYGVTGTNSHVFSITEDGSATSMILAPDPATVHSFTYLPIKPLFLNDNYTLICPIVEFGDNGGGYLMSVGTDGLNAHSILDYGYDPRGRRALTGLTKQGASVLYGVTQVGGTGGGGTIYKRNADGTGFTTLYSFSGTSARYPGGPLLLASDGKLYGVCQLGGNPSNIYQGGVIYRINTDGTGFTILKQFNTAGQGNVPIGNLTEGPGAVLYGITYSNLPASDNPVIYKINMDGTGYTVLHAFNASGSEGQHPYEGLLLYGSTLYGTCRDGGTGGGTLFKVQTDGTAFSVLRNMAYSNPEGMTPNAGLTVVPSLNRIYGICSFGGANGAGSVYSIASNGTGFTTHFSFDVAANGFVNFSRMVQASDNNLYGTNIAGGTYGYGTFFRYNPFTNTFTTLYQMPASRQGSYSPLVEIPFLANLPVTISRFSAQKQQEQVKIFWQAQTDAAGAYFEVERSADGRNFSKLMRVPALGNPGEMMAYEQMDYFPLAGVNYYRLKTVEADGHTGYSSHVMILMKKGEEMMIYPVPASDHIYLQSGYTVMNPADIKLIDIQGRTLRTIRVDAPVQRIELNNLQPGVYFLRSQNGNNIRFVKQ